MLLQRVRAWVGELDSNLRPPARPGSGLLSRLPLVGGYPISQREREPEKVKLRPQSQEGAELGSPGRLSLHSRPFTVQ